MKKLIIVLALVIPGLLSAQDQPEYIMYRNIKMTPKADKAAEFMKALGAHNKKYHSGQQPHHASVWRPISGPDIGSIIYSIGPLTFKDMDMREVQEGHDDDWAAVMNMSEGFEDQGFWRLDPGISTPGGTQYTKLRIRIIDLDDAESYRFEEGMKKIAKTYAEKRPNNSDCPRRQARAYRGLVYHSQLIFC